MKHLFQFIWKTKALRTAAAKGLSLLLAVALVFSVLPPPAFALTESDFEVIWLEGVIDVSAVSVILSMI